MDEQRMGEIALACFRYFIKMGKSSTEVDHTELERALVEAGISKTELLEFFIRLELEHLSNLKGIKAKFDFLLRVFKDFILD